MTAFEQWKSDHGVTTYGRHDIWKAIHAGSACSAEGLTELDTCKYLAQLARITAPPSPDDHAMTPHQRIRGLLGVLGFKLEDGCRRTGEEWRHPECAAIADEDIGRVITTEAQLVKQIYRAGLAEGAARVRTELKRAINGF